MPRGRFGRDGKIPIPAALGGRLHRDCEVN